MNASTPERKALRSADAIAADFAEIPFENHEAKTLALAYIELKGANQWLRDDVALKAETIAAAGWPVRVEEPAGEPDEDLYLEHTEHRIAEMSGERVAQSANADVRELANTVRERLQKGERDAELLEGREHSFTPWRRAYMALDEIADLARREASLPVPVGDETEALRAALDALRDAAEGWPTPNFYTDAADAGEKALARVAGLEAREARLRRAAEDAIEAYEGDRTESQAFRAALDRLRVAVAALPSGEDAF